MSAHPVTRIAATDRLSPLRELPRFGGLLYFLVWRDVKVRYKQTALGVLWAVLQPAGIVLAATLAFRAVGPEGVSYPLFVATGVVPWFFFARAVGDAAASPVENERLLTKVYFPRILLPVSAVGAVLVEVAIALVVLVAVSGAFTWRLVAVAPAMLVVLVTAVGLGSAAAALNVRYRDARYAIPFAVQLTLLLTPVLYASRAVSEPWSFVVDANPLAGAIETVRWALLERGEFPAGALATSAGVSLFVLIAGVWIFRRGEDAFADEI
jgi:lipopolysaccharide transport system permease protein